MYNTYEAFLKRQIYSLHYISEMRFMDPKKKKGGFRIVTANIVLQGN